MNWTLKETLQGVVACAVLTLLIAAPASGQSDSVLRGVITSAEDGRTLPGANVVLRGRESDIRKATSSGQDGYYELRGIPPASYILRVSFIGFETYRDTLRLDGQERAYSVELTSQAKRLEEVRVEVEKGATRRQAGLQTVGAADLERIPTPGPSGDLASYLQTLPGVVSAGSRGGGLNIRGGKVSQNLFLVDDIPIVKPLHISNFYSAFPKEAVKSADVYAGGFGAKYMGKLSAVVDVTLRKGNMKKYAGSASVSPFISSARVEGPLEKGSQSFLAVVRHSTVRKTADPLLGQEVPLTFYDMTGRYSLQHESASCSITGMRTYDEGRLSNEQNTAMTWANSAIGGNCLLFGTGLNYALEVSGGYSQFTNSAGTIGDTERSAGLRRGFFDIEQEQETAWGTFRLGVRTKITSYQFSLDQKFTLSNTGRPFGGVIYTFGSLKKRVGDYLTVHPSIGFQIHSRISPPTYEPRLRLSYRPDGTDQQEISLSLGKYNQVSQGITDAQDAGTEFTVWTPEPLTERPPRALHSILGYRQEIVDAIELSVEGYAKDMANLSVQQWSPVDRFETNFALADGFSYGLDARLELKTDPFYLYAGYGWSKVKYEAAQEDLGAWLDGTVFEYFPSHDQRHQFNVVGGVEIGKVSARLSWMYGSGRPYTQAYGFDLAPNIINQFVTPEEESGRALVLFDEPYGGRLPPSHRLDVSVSRPFDVAPGVTLEAEAGAINAYDRKNIFYYDISRDNVVSKIPVYPYVSATVRIN